MYSLTKYMNGHSDVIMGAAITNRDDLAERLRFLQNGTFYVFNLYCKSSFICVKLIFIFKLFQL